MIGDQNISLAKSKVVFKMTEEATRNIQNGLKEVKGLYTTAEVNAWMLFIVTHIFNTCEIFSPSDCSIF